jgi:hypothetical protein
VIETSIQAFLNTVSYFIDMSLQNEWFQLIYGFLAIAFAIVIIKNILEIGR